MRLEALMVEGISCRRQRHEESSDPYVCNSWALHVFAINEECQLLCIT